MFLLCNITQFLRLCVISKKFESFKTPALLNISVKMSHLPGLVLLVGPCYTDLWSYEGWILILRGWGTGGGGMSLDNRQTGHNDHLGDTRH